jgi:hypothetical protein
LKQGKVGKETKALNQGTTENSVSLDVQTNKVDLPINQTNLIQNNSRNIFLFLYIHFHISTKKKLIRDSGQPKQLSKSSTKPRKKEGIFKKKKFQIHTGPRLLAVQLVDICGL